LTELALPPSDSIGRYASRPGYVLGALVLVILAAFASTGYSLATGPWQTDQEGHGPFIIAASLYFVWELRDRLAKAKYRPAPVLGWAALLCGLVLMYVGRSQSILWLETLALLPLLTGAVLMIGGWPVYRLLAFPILILFFAVPPPGWLLDALTLPLKAMISDWVTRLLYHLGYPIAQNGVVIMIGPYQLLVKDACAGMNSIFALSAIGIIYLYIMEYGSRTRNIILLLSIIPITVAANFLRVLVLVLVAFHYGSASVEGWIHDATGFALFIVAFAIIIMFDGVLSLLLAIARRLSGGRKQTMA
jgi:exosortase